MRTLLALCSVKANHDFILSRNLLPTTRPAAVTNAYATDCNRTGVASEHIKALMEEQPALTHVRDLPRYLMQ